MDNAAISIAIISAVVTLIGGGFATYQQLRKDAKANNVELIRLQEEIERDLWGRMKGEFADMRTRLDSQDAIIKQQGATIQEQGALLMQHRERIKVLENENGILKEENERLKGTKTGGKRI